MTRMPETTKFLIQQSYLLINWLTAFIVVQNLTFCNALGKDSRLSKIMENKSIAWITVALTIILTAISIIVINEFYSNIASLMNLKPGAKHYNIHDFQKWIRISSIAIYLAFPTALLLVMKIFKLIEVKGLNGTSHIGDDKAEK